MISGPVRKLAQAGRRGEPVSLPDDQHQNDDRARYRAVPSRTAAAQTPALRMQLQQVDAHRTDRRRPAPPTAARRRTPPAQVRSSRGRPSCRPRTACRRATDMRRRAPPAAAEQHRTETDQAHGIAERVGRDVVFADRPQDQPGTAAVEEPARRRQSAPARCRPARPARTGFGR